MGKGKSPDVRVVWCVCVLPLQMTWAGRGDGQKRSTSDQFAPALCPMPTPCGSASSVTARIPFFSTPAGARRASLGTVERAGVSCRSVYVGGWSVFPHNGFWIFL
jgi:hypothetical protein